MTEKLKVSASRELATEKSENQVTRNSNKEAVPTSVELFNDLPKFREMNEKLKVSANKELAFLDDDFIELAMEESENQITRNSNEEPVPTSVVVGEPLVVYCCGWGSIVRKYKTHTTNHYINCPFLHISQDSRRNASQVKLNIFPMEKVNFVCELISVFV